MFANIKLCQWLTVRLFDSVSNIADTNSQNTNLSLNVDRFGVAIAKAMIKHNLPKTYFSYLILTQYHDASA